MSYMRGQRTRSTIMVEMQKTFQCPFMGQAKGRIATIVISKIGVNLRKWTGRGLDGAIIR